MTAKRFTQAQIRQIGKLASDAWTSLGYNHGDVQRILTSPGFVPGLRELFQKEATGGSALATSLVPAGWTVVEDVAASQFDVASLRPRRILRDGESYIGGDEMRRRAVTNEANWGLADGQRILAEQTVLSAEFRGYYIPLAGTVLRGSDGNLHVAYLNWDGDRWVLDFNWLDDDWNDNDRFAVRDSLHTPPTLLWGSFFFK